jgi:hypothetical protein
MLVLSKSFHLMLRPDAERIARPGAPHRRLT